MSAAPDHPPSTAESGAPVRNWLLSVLGILIILGLGVEIWAAYRPSEATERLDQLFSLSYEGNIPTWYSSCLLFWCGLWLARIGVLSPSTRSLSRRHWLILAVIFFYLSLDEAVGIHENLGGWVEAGGVLYFDWIIPAGIAVLILGIFFVPFLRNLPGKTRNRFILAGGLYVGGALLMELPLGYWTSHYGDDNLGYALLDWFEETLELGGATLFLLALRNYFGGAPSEATP